MDEVMEREGLVTVKYEGQFEGELMSKGGLMEK